MRVLAVVILLIALAMAAGAYFLINPVIPIFIILAAGLVMLGRSEGTVLPPDRSTHWGSGQGIYFDPDDVWVQGSEADERYRKTNPPQS